MARILASVSDLMLASRVAEPLKAAGYDVTVRAPDGGSLPDVIDADLVVCDLDVTDPEPVAALDVPSIGFYSHLDVETGRRAREAGIDLVIPRSRMARELPVLVERLLAAGGKPG